MLLRCFFAVWPVCRGQCGRRVAPAVWHSAGLLALRVMVLEVSIGVEGVEVSLVGPPSFLQLLLSVGLFEDWAEDHGGKVLFHMWWGGGGTRIWWEK